MTNSIDITLANEQSALAVDEGRLRQAVAAVLADAEIASAEISLAVVTDEVIHDLNVRYLDHDYPTDVLSFPLGDDQGRLAGEIVVSADTAIAQAARHRDEQQLTPDEWHETDELLLYVVHGALHLVGYGDKNAADAEQMRRAEDRILAQFDRAIPRDSAVLSDETHSIGDAG